MTGASASCPKAAILELGDVAKGLEDANQQDFEVCTGKTKITREERRAAFYLVTGKEGQEVQGGPWLSSTTSPWGSPQRL